MRARNMQALTNDTRSRHPGVVIYGVGDDAHKLRSSDHNEDDTAGVRASQSDADNVPEHRAIDVMLGPQFTRAQANQYVADLLADPAALARLVYIIFNGSIWERKNAWKRRDQVGDQHTDHVHVSGYAPDDENAAGWPAVYGSGDDMFCKFGETNTKVEALQRLIVAAGGSVGAVGSTPDYDGNYGNNTANGLKALLGYGDGKTYGPREYADLFVKLARKQAGTVGVPGPTGPAGPAGPAGPKGDAAVLAPGTTLIVG